MFFTEKQLRIMKFIQQFRSDKGISPTMAEIATKLGVTKITVYDHLNQLERKGALKRERFRARSIEPLVWVGQEKGQFALPILGEVRSGSPLQDGKAEEILDLKSIFPFNSKCFVLRVRGESLHDDGIRDGDYVIVERRSEAKNGDLVVAVVGGNRVTIARFYREKNRIRLSSSNREKKPIFARPKDVDVRGILMGLLRNFVTAARN
jgi:repressor LexA